jgi:hypothetical protein
MDLRETCHGRGAAIELRASRVCVHARHFLLARRPWRNTVWRRRLDITGVMKMTTSRDAAGVNTCSGIADRCVLVLLQARSQVFQTALKLLDILPRHRRIGCGLALILTLDITACIVSAGTDTHLEQQQKRLTAAIRAREFFIALILFHAAQITRPRRSRTTRLTHSWPRAIYTVSCVC